MPILVASASSPQPSPLASATGSVRASTAVTPSGSSSPHSSTSHSSSLLGLLLPLLLIVLVVLLFTRPQRARQRQMAQVRSQLTPGQTVQLSSGLLATVVDTSGDVVTLEVAPGVHSRYLAAAVSRVVDSPDAFSTSGGPVTGTSSDGVADESADT